MAQMREMDDTCRLHLWLHYGVSGNAHAFRQAKMHFPDLQEAYRLAATGSRTGFSFLSDAAVNRLIEAADEAFLDRYTDWLSRHRVGVSLLMDEDYPALLREISDAPPLLFYRGRLEPSPRLPVAMVGSRLCTQYGREVAHLFAHDLTAAGCTIISGMADGIDGCAARGALSCEESPYPTVAVLGSGIDVIYPSCHRDLYEEIAERGAVITEFLPGTRPMRENFPIRNRIMSGMARGLIVVEAGDRSGTSITAGYALDQGREVFAVPGRLTDLQSIGTNRMIQRGEAKPIFCVADVLQEFEQMDDYDAFQSCPKRIALDTLSPDERAVCSALRTESHSFDDLAEMLSLPVGQLNSLLTGMQFSGIIKPLSGRLYALDTLNTVLVDDSSANEGLEDDLHG